MPAYAFLRGLLRGMLGLFFRQIEVVGRENISPAGVPVVFAGNHPNSLIDPAMIVVTCGRVVCFAAKDVLFESAVLRPILHGLGAVPLARRTDHAGKAIDNRDAFSAMVGVLAQGRAIGIFPEGISHDAAQLQRLKTGAARLAVQATREHPDLNLRIVPVGMTYVRRKRFRSRVLVQYGTPIEVDARAPAPDSEEEREGVRTLTDRIDLGLRALTINAPDWNTLRVLDGVRRLYQPPQISLEQRVELARRFTSVYATVRDEPAVRVLYDRVADYLDRLRASGLTDRDLSARQSPARLAWRWSSQLALLAVWLPLALPGAVLLLPLAFVVGNASVGLAPRTDVIATSKLVLGTLLVLGLHAAAFVLIGWRFHWTWGVAAALALAVSGYACVRVLDRLGSLTRISARAVRSLLFGERIKDLVRERDALVAEVEQAVDRFLPATMPRLFPPPSDRASEI